MIVKVITMSSSDRDALRFELDSLPDVFVHGNDIGFTKAFRTLTSEETFCAVPKCVIEKAQALLTDELVDSIPKTVHDKVFFEMGCN